MSDHSSTTIQLDGLGFRCRLDGPEGAPWLVFSNSLLTNLTLRDPQVAAFGDRFRILRYDQRGHGGTDVPPGPANLDQLVQDAAGLLDAFGITGATVVGVSMGAATALCLAARSPQLVARVVGSDGQAGTAPGGAAVWQERMDFARDKGMEAAADATVRRWFHPDSVAAGIPAVGKVREMVRTTPQDGFIACATALQGYDFRAELGNIRQPALLVAGEADGAMPKTMRAMQAAIPGAGFVEIPGAGHLPNIEKPEAFNAALAEFLGG